MQANAKKRISMRVFAQENYSVVTADNEEHLLPGDAALNMQYATIVWNARYIKIPCLSISFVISTT